MLLVKNKIELEPKRFPLSLESITKNMNDKLKRKPTILAENKEDSGTFLDETVLEDTEDT